MSESEVPVGSIPPFGLRMQPDLKARIEEEAKRSGRSINAEIVFRLRSSVESDDVARQNLLHDYKTIISLPEDTKERIRLRAEENQRSLNSEILYALEKEYPDLYPIGDIIDAVESALRSAMRHGSDRQTGELQEVLFKASQFMMVEYEDRDRPDKSTDLRGYYAKRMQELNELLQCATASAEKPDREDK